MLVDLPTAVALLRSGALVAIPTETVYGLAADGGNPSAIARIFSEKGRPTGHPLILHVLSDPSPWAVLDARARALVDAFWPGPLTLVLPRTSRVPDALTGGRDTVAIRSPLHPVCRALLHAFGGPLAAPSANRFGRVSPTTAAHVAAELPHLPVLDGGPCAHGLESTIVDLSGSDAAILRPGPVSAEAVAAVVGALSAPGGTAAPGTLSAHYAPGIPVFPTADPEATSGRLSALGMRVVVIRALPPEDHARALYGLLRSAEESGAEAIVAEWCRPEGVGVAVNDRLRRAAAGSGGAP